MKKLLLPLLGIIIMISCKKESFFDKTVNKMGAVDTQFKSSKIEVCHNAGNNNWHTINISINALPAHLAHGDIVPDADGDGYTKVNPCGVGGQDDCDDNNAAIHPAVTEICGNNLDDNCNGQVDEGCILFVTICAKDWMLKNLDVDKYRDGSKIPQAATDSEWTTAGIAGTGVWCYIANNTTYGTVYGKLYNWYAVNDPRGLAPAGWHVPSNGEWATLETCLDAIIPNGNVGGKIKETGLTHWISPNTGATNSSGFTGLPGGYRYPQGGWSNYPVGQYGSWWSATESSTNAAWGQIVDAFHGTIARAQYDKHDGFSVRCVRD